jgi:DNA-binding NtrC family response regulator
MGPSSVIDRLASEVARVAKTNFSVLILGETGTGKELVARATHALSFRSQNSDTTTRVSVRLTAPPPRGRITAFATSLRTGNLASR